MKKLALCSSFALAITAALAAETVIAHWDFTQEQLTSGKYTFNKRGEAGFVTDTVSGKKVLSPCTVGKNHAKGCGLSLKGDPRKELLPMDGFEVALRICYKDPAGGRIKGANMYLFDGAYASKNGAALQLHITSRNEFMLRILYGDGTKLHNVLVAAPMLGDGKWHDVALRYYDDQLLVKVDGKVVKTILPMKPLTDSTVRFCVGDRVASGYQPFPGLIEYVKITQL